MPACKGYCTNFGLCEKADRKKSLKIRWGRSVVCPECGQPLDISGPQGRFPWRIVTFTIAIFLTSAAVEVYRYEPHLEESGQARTEFGFESFIQRFRSGGRAVAALSLSVFEEVRQRWELSGEEIAREEQKAGNREGKSSQKENGTESGEQASIH